MRKALIPALFAALGVLAQTGAAQSLDLHTGGRSWVVSPSEGQRRILPDGRAILLKVGPESTGASYLFLGAEEVPPGTRIPRHRHEVDEEILIVQRGELTVLLNDSVHTAPAGSVVYLSPRTWIAVENRGREPASLMFVFPRGAVERCFQYVGRSPEQVAAGQPFTQTATQEAEERHACQMTYHPGPGSAHSAAAPPNR